MPKVPPITIVDLKEDAYILVAEGFVDEDEIVETLTTWFSVDPQSDELIRDPEVVRPIARRAMISAIRAHRRCQAKWPAVTDCDRLDTAFALLERRGVVARQHFFSCKADGLWGIEGEMDTVQASRKRPVVGYAFYHTQSTESAMESGVLYIMYGSATRNDVAGDIAVGRRVVRALKEAGLAPDWSGDPREAVDVPILWQRRRPNPVA